MRKNVFGRQFQRDTNERKALFKSLASSLVLVERIKTTEQKAKAVRPYIEKLVTRARMGNDAQRLVEPYLTKAALEKMMGDIALRFVKRPGGYVRIIHAGNRLADNADMVIMEWVEKRSNFKSQNAKPTEDLVKVLKKDVGPKTTRKPRTARKEKKV